MGLTIDPGYGGQGVDALTAVRAMESFGYACRDNGLAFAIGAHLWSAAAPLQRFGNDEQKRRWLPSMCEGTTIAVHAVTEPDAGSDVLAMRTRARPDGTDYVLHGSKTFISNAPLADLFIIFAVTDPQAGPLGMSAFLVPRTTPGLDVGPAFSKMGLTTSPTSEVILDRCRIPEDMILGRPGAGLAVFSHSIDWERSCLLASAVGSMSRQVADCVAYARQRRQFGRPIGTFQAVSHRIADMKVRTEAARQMLYLAATEKDRRRGDAAPETSSMAKLFISEAWIQNSIEALQIHGGYGYMTESGVERDVRDALGSRIFSGTSDIQRTIIATHLGL